MLSWFLGVIGWTIFLIQYFGVSLGNQGLFPCSS